MTDHICERVLAISTYILRTGATVRKAAEVFHCSKSTVHKDLCQRLPELNPALYLKIRRILDRNKAERHIRGGLSTRRKYKGI